MGRMKLLTVKVRRAVTRNVGQNGRPAKEAAFAFQRGLPPTCRAIFHRFDLSGQCIQSIFR